MLSTSHCRYPLKVCSNLTDTFGCTRASTHTIRCLRSQTCSWKYDRDLKASFSWQHEKVKGKNPLPWLSNSPGNGEEAKNLQIIPPKIDWPVTLAETYLWLIFHANPSICLLSYKQTGKLLLGRGKKVVSATIWIQHRDTRGVGCSHMNASSINLKERIIKASEDVPVINHGGLDCKKQKRHDSVADGQLGGCPS